MIEIIEEIQEKYSINCEKEFVFFGGDLLTEERARNNQFAKVNGKTRTDRFEGLSFKNEDWHFERIAYKVIILKNENTCFI